ncbi:MAG: hypothetical protein WAV22_07655 [Porticoccaceae bacterium]
MNLRTGGHGIVQKSRANCVPEPSAPEALLMAGFLLSKLVLTPLDWRINATFTARSFAHSSLFGETAG